jgi:hypothetical protein
MLCSSFLSQLLFPVLFTGMQHSVNSTIALVIFFLQVQPYVLQTDFIRVLENFASFTRTL